MDSRKDPQKCVRRKFPNYNSYRYSDRYSERYSNRFFDKLRINSKINKKPQNKPSANNRYYGFMNGGRNFDNRHRYHKKKEKNEARPSSPLCGSEEYTLRKIQQTSDMIKKKLLMPLEDLDNSIVQKESTIENDVSEFQITTNQVAKSHYNSIEKGIDKDNLRESKKMNSYNIEEIHSKIINHISHLNYSKKMNLINANNSGYDVAIQQIYKQKSLELSNALRVMCSQSKPTASEVVNSIIPDFGIKIEDLPLEVIRELSSTLDLGQSCLNITENFDKTNQELEYPFRNLPKFGNSTRSSMNARVEPTHIKWTSRRPSSCDMVHRRVTPDVFETWEGLSENSLHENSSGGERLFGLVDEANDLPSLNQTSSNYVTNIVGDETVPTENSSMQSNEQSQIDSHWIKTVIREGQDSVIIKTEYIEDQSILAADLQDEVVIKEENIKEEILPSDSMRVENTIVGEGSHVCSEYAVPIDAEQDESPEVSIEVQHNEMICGTTQTTRDDVISNHDITYTNSSPTLDKRKNKLEHLAGNDANKTKIPLTNNGSQTESVEPNRYSSHFSYIEPRKPNILKDAIDFMFSIDKEIERLTRLRQNIFTDICFSQENVPNEGNGRYLKSLEEADKRILKKRKFDEKLDRSFNLIDKFSVSQSISNSEDPKKPKPAFNIVNVKSTPPKTMSYLDKEGRYDFTIPSKVLVIKIMANRILAGMENGSIHFIDLHSGHFSNSLPVTDRPITSISLHQNSSNGMMCVGSLAPCLKVYAFKTKTLTYDIPLPDGIQCMDGQWDNVFIGLTNGSLMRYSYKRKRIMFEDVISNATILVIKATVEGARRVLLIGSRNSPVCIRDAFTGLHLRTMEDVTAPTVYSMLVQNSMVYCGTASHDIQVHNFHDGKLKGKLRSSNSKSIGCLNTIKNLLFAGCHDGNIYVFNTLTNEFIDHIEGPSGIILSIEVLYQKILLVSTILGKFTAIMIPNNILNHVKIDTPRNNVRN